MFLEALVNIQGSAEYFILQFDYNEKNGIARALFPMCETLLPTLGQLA